MIFDSMIVDGAGEMSVADVVPSVSLKIDVIINNLTHVKRKGRFDGRSLGS